MAARPGTPTLGMKRQGHPYTGRRFRKALRYFIVGRSAQAIASVAVVLLAIRLLPPTDYGAYMVLLGIVEFCRPLSSLGLLPTVQQFLPEMALHASMRQLRSFVRWVTLARFATLGTFAAVLYFFWGTVSGWLGFDDVQGETAWVACLLIVTMLGATFNDHMLESLLEQRFAQFIRSLYPIGRLIGLIALAATDRATLINMLWVDIAVSTVCLVLSEVVLLRQLRRLQPDGSRRFEVRELLTFAWHLSGAQVLNAASSGGALRAIVSGTLGVTSAGHFAFMQQLLTQLRRFLPSLMLANLVRPMLIAARVAGERQRVQAAVGLLWKSNMLLALPMVGLVLVGGDALASSLSGGRLSQAGLALTVMALATVSSAQSQITNIILQVFRHSALVRSLSLMALAAPLFVFAGGQYSLVAVVAGVALATWLRSSVSVLALQRRESYVRLDVPGVARVLAAVVLSAAAAWPLRGFSWLLAAAAFALVYLLSLWLLKPLSRADGDILLTVVTGRSRAVLDAVVRAVQRPDRDTPR